MPWPASCRTIRSMSPFSSRAAAVCGAAYLLLAAVLVAGPPYGDELTTSNYVSDAAFVVALLAGIPALLGLAAALGDRRAGIVAACGGAIVAIGVGVEIALGHEPSWFVVAGVPGNVLAFAGTALLAVRAQRTRALPPALVVLLALSVPIGVGLGGIGGSVVPAAFWLVVGVRGVRAAPAAIVASAVALVALSLLSAGAPPALAAARRPASCARRHPRDPRRELLCEGRSGALAGRFRMTAFRIDGTISVRQSGPGHLFTAEGTTAYRPRGALTRRAPFSLTGPTVVGSAGPVRWTAATDAEWVEGDFREDCSAASTPAAAPPEFGGVFSSAPNGRTVTVTWMIVNEGWGCPTRIAAIDELPAETQTVTYPASRFAGRTVVLPIAIDHDWAPDDDTFARVSWHGDVRLERV